MQIEIVMMKIQFALVLLLSCLYALFVYGATYTVAAIAALAPGALIGLLFFRLYRYIRGRKNAKSN